MTLTAEEMTAYDCAMEFGRTYEFTALIDTVQPPRSALQGRIHFYHHPNKRIGSGIILERAKSFPDGYKAGYLIDTGVSMTPAVVAGWRSSDNYAILKYPQRGQLLVPRRFYHLKLEA